MSVILDKTNSYKGEVISRFEDGYGKELDYLFMADDVVIVFESGKKLHLSIEYYGCEAYIAQDKS
jgi:hypothetical protein